MDAYNNGMNNGMMEGHELDWDGVIEEDDEYIILPPDDYNFVIKGYDRTRFNGSEKMPPCNQVTVDIAINYNGKEVIIKHKLFLHSKVERILSAFFRGIGQKKKGEPLKMNWPMVPGSTGRCKIGTKIYNGNEYNEIKKFYPKDEMPVTPQATPYYNPGQF